MEPNPPATTMPPKTPKIWKTTAIISVAIAVPLIALSTFLIVDKINHKNNTTDQDDTSQTNDIGDGEEEEEEIGTFFIPEWNIKFTIPDSLIDIRYVIASNEYITNDAGTAYLIGRPSDGSLPYPPNVNSRIKDEPLAAIYRSTSSTQIVFDDFVVQGKPIGDYYFYTAWSFSSLASGAGVPSIFDVNQTTHSDALNDVFHEINDMLNSIQPTN